MRVATVAAKGGYSCRALAIGSKQAYMYLAVQTAANQTDSAFRVEVVLTDGRTLPIGTVDIHNGKGAFGGVVQARTTQLEEMRVYDAGGNLRYKAPFKAPETQPTPTTVI
jgi:hypothetical protein